MFRKTWKTLKYMLIVVILVIVVPHSIFPRRNSSEASSKSEYKNDVKIKAGDLTKPSKQDSVINTKSGSQPGKEK